mgnify:CR=1 FL=1
MFSESLDELENIVVPLFKDVENRHVEKLNFPYEQHPWGKNELRHVIYAPSSTSLFHNEDMMRLVFRVPDIRHQYKTAVSSSTNIIIMNNKE